MNKKIEWEWLSVSRQGCKYAYKDFINKLEFDNH